LALQADISLNRCHRGEFIGHCLEKAQNRDHVKICLSRRFAIMSPIRRAFVRKALLPAAALAFLAGCAPTFEARVARFSALPAPSGQSFVIQPRDAVNAGGLEFSTYANLVRQRLVANGYVEAATPAQASVIVLLDYNVGPPHEKIETRPGYPIGWGGWGPGYGWSPYWGGGWGRGYAGWGGWGAWSAP
jgi:hypothetical protein